MPAFVETSSASPYIYGCPFYPGQLGSGFGTAYSSPSTVPNAIVQAVVFSKENTDFFLASNSSPYLYGYTFDVDSGFGTKYSNPSTLPVDSAVDIKVAICANSDDKTLDVAIGSNSSPFINAYTFASGTGFGTKYTNPASLPSYRIYEPAFCGTTDIACASYGKSVPLPIYPWTSGVGFGARYTPITYGSSTTLLGADFSPDGTDLALASSGGYGLNMAIGAYPFTTGVGTGTVYTNAQSISVATHFGYSVAFSDSGDTLAGGIHPSINGTYVLVAYNFTQGVGFGSLKSILASGYPNDTIGVDFYGDTVIGGQGNGVSNDLVYDWDHDTQTATAYNPASTLDQEGHDCAFTYLSSEPETSACPMPPFRSIWPYIPVELWYRFSGRCD